MKKRSALIIGISGQDGGYLAQLLLNKGYEESQIKGPELIRRLVEAELANGVVIAGTLNLNRT